MLPSHLNSTKFFSNPPTWLKPFTIYVWGDGLWILPFWGLVTMLAFWWWKLALLLSLIFYFLRFLGEMFYWLLQQFSDRSYRPHDWGFSQLDNHAVYIWYQTFSLVAASVLGAGIIVFCFKIGL